MGLLLFLVAILLYLPLTAINIGVVLYSGFSWKRLDGYFLQTAIDIDRFGNRNFRTLLSKTLTLSECYPFGDPRETISSVLGKNKRIGNLSKTGIIIASILDFLDKNHCEKSIQWFS